MHFKSVTQLLCIIPFSVVATVQASAVEFLCIVMSWYPHHCGKLEHEDKQDSVHGSEWHGSLLCLGFPVAVAVAAG